MFDFLKKFKNSSVLLQSISLAFLSVLLLILYVRNYAPGTWFWGWDNLVPEIDTGLTFKRQLQSVWQEYQGFGNIGGHGYGAAIIHTAFIWFLDIFFPSEILRYLFTYSMHAAGVFGCYFLMQWILQKIKTTQTQVQVIFTSLASSVIYALHLGTIETFYVQLEPFIMFFAFLPWTLLSLFLLLEKFSKKTTLFFLVCQILLSSIGFIPPVFVFYGLFISIVLLFYILDKTSQQAVSQKIKKSIGILLCILAVNSYWLLPFLYYSVTSTGVYLSSKLNTISTSEFILKHTAYGDLSSVALLKGFFFDSINQQFNNLNQNSILQPWVDNFSLVHVRLIGYAFFILSAIGTIRAFYNNHFYTKAIAAIFTLHFSILAIQVFPFSLLTTLISYIPILNQAFRSPFNKVSMSASLMFALTIGFALFYFSSYLIKQSHLRSRLTASLLPWVIIISCILYSLPSFNGNFLYSGNKVIVPEEYFSLFSYLKTQPKTSRIATFPLHNYNGWSLYSWGYIGSGFLWYGIEQPLLDRAFDVWSPYNETLYNQLSFALYNQDQTAFQNILKKYDIQLLLIDKNIFIPGENQTALQYEKTEELLALMATPIWQEGSLVLYSFSEDSELIQTPETYRVIKANTDYTRIALPYDQIGNFIEKDTAAHTYPFSSLTRLKTILATDSSFISLPLEAEKPGTFTIDGLESNSVYKTFATITATESAVTISFDSKNMLQTSTNQQFLPNIPIITIPHELNTSDLILDINDQIIPVSNTPSRHFIERLLVNEPLTIKFFRAQDSQMYQDEIIITNNNVQQYTADATIWQGLLQPFSAEVQPNTTFQLEKHSLDLLPTLARSTLLSCGTNSDFIDRNISENGVTFTAEQNNAVCSRIQLPSYRTNENGFLHVAGINNYGKSLKLFFEDQTRALPIQEELLSEKQFDTFFPLLGNTYNQPTSMYVTFETKAHGAVASSNQVSDLSINFISYPIRTVHNARVTYEDITYKNDIITSNQKKHGNFLYTTTVSNDNLGLLVLNQGFDKGWIAFSKNAPLNIFKHVKYNGWANAWEVPSGSTQHIVILYWPQLLSYLGYCILGITILTTVMLMFKITKRPYNTVRLKVANHLTGK